MLRSLPCFAVAALLLTGCNVTTHDDGKNKDVEVHVPFANMHVKTNGDADTAGIGLAAYPGAVPAMDDNDKDSDAADINMSFGSFHLGVKAASFTTTDSPAKVEAFYRNDMKRYGDVIKCVHDQPVGQPTTTSQGLNCNDDNNHGNVHGNVNTDGKGEPELRAGSPTHQHVVSIEPKNGGTKFGLVLLDLPKGDHGDSKAE